MKVVKTLVSGRVQGVGFRYFVKSHADSLNIKGYARNLRDGRVEVLMQGEDASLNTLISHIRKGPRFSSVTAVEIETIENALVQSDFVTS